MAGLLQRTPFSRGEASATFNPTILNFVHVHIYSSSEPLVHCPLSRDDFSSLEALPIADLGHEQIITPLQIQDAKAHVKRDGQQSNVDDASSFLSLSHPEHYNVPKQVRINNTSNRYPRKIKANRDELDTD